MDGLLIFALPSTKTGVSVDGLTLLTYPSTECAVFVDGAVKKCCPAQNRTADKNTSISIDIQRPVHHLLK